MQGAFIAGAGYLKGALPHLSPNGLAAEALTAAARDAGITCAAVDGIIYQAGQGGGLDPDFVRIAGSPATFIWSVASGGSSALAGIITAASLVERGLARHVAVVYASSQKSRRLLIGSTETPPALEAYGLYSPGAYAALRASRYLGRFGLPPNAFAPVVIAQRRNASLRPEALYFGRPLSAADYDAARWVVEPLRLFDYCQPLDAGAAVIVSAAEHARMDRSRAIQVSGYGLYHTRAQAAEGVSEYEGIKGHAAVQAALDMAGIGLADVNVAQVYDAFSIAVLEQIEEIGVCGPGEASAFIAEGRTAPGGEFPMNTGGGQIGWGYMQGHTPIVEAIRQVRGECGETQVPNVRHALVTTPGGWSTGRAFAAAVFSAVA